MGLAWFLVYWKWRASKTRDEEYNKDARFWAEIFGLRRTWSKPSFSMRVMSSSVVKERRRSTV
ncbi:hypothetical protein [Granulicella sp. L60]|uniref:hypothetical protein n=1 Tax=Granulicella sp. L60 TaxID=1641866 RepID=UPI00131E010D